MGEASNSLRPDPPFLGRIVVAIIFSVIADGQTIFDDTVDDIADPAVLG
jgi:hypothetical protein